jgi:hypothetical protein
MATQLGYADYGYTTPVQTASGAPYAEVTANPRYIEDPRVAPSVNPTMMSQFGGSRRRKQRSRRQRSQSSRRQRSSRQLRSRSRSQRSRSQQRGGGCLCGTSLQVGGGSGSGGHSFALDNSLGKTVSDYPVGACPPAPVATQIGGAAVDDLGIVSHRAGVTYMPQGVVDVGSAQYLDRLTYNADCQSGGARRSRRHRRQSKRRQLRSRSRRQHKQSRRS